MSHKRIVRPTYLYENLERLPHLLEERGMLQKDLEMKALLPHGQLTRWLSGESYPSQDSYNKLATYFGWMVWP